MIKLDGILYRIMTEDINRSEVIKTANKYFSGYSISEPGTRSGYWRGVGEKSILLEVITDDKASVMSLANDIKLINNQESVLVEVIKNSAYLV